MSETCQEVAYACRCRETVGHEQSHRCPCGGVWHYDDGEFVIDTLPPATPVPGLKYNEEW